MKSPKIKDYVALAKNTRLLFKESSPDCPGVDVKLLFEGDPQSGGISSIVLRDPVTGAGYRVVAGVGPAGISLSVSVLDRTGSRKITLHGNDAQYNQIMGGEPIEPVQDVHLTIYNQDDRSQAFKRWYHNQETEADIAILGEGYRRVPATHEVKNA